MGILIIFALLLTGRAILRFFYPQYEKWVKPRLTRRFAIYLCLGTALYSASYWVLFLYTHMEPNFARFFAYIIASLPLAREMITRKEFRWLVANLLFWSCGAVIYVLCVFLLRWMYLPEDWLPNSIFMFLYGIVASVAGVIMEYQAEEGYKTWREKRQKNA